jgi:hypothetical protein
MSEANARHVDAVLALPYIKPAVVAAKGLKACRDRQQHLVRHCKELTSNSHQPVVQQITPHNTHSMCGV